MNIQVHQSDNRSRITLSINANLTSADIQKEIKEVFKKNPDKEIIVKVENEQPTEKAAKFETVQDNNNALDFAVQNVDKYYPDMKEHLDSLINSFRDQEHRDSTLTLLNIMAANISDPEQKTGAIILALEYVFRGNTIFSDTYDSKITDGTFAYIEKFDKDYKIRFRGYYDRLLITINTLKQELEKSKQELEKNISKFTPEDIMGNPPLKQLIINTETFYKKNNYTAPKNIQRLFDIARQ